MRSAHRTPVIGTTVRRIPRTALAIGVAVFLVLSGTGTASALWSTIGSTLTSSATAGSVAFTQTGANGLTKVYSPGDLVDFAPITVTNTGTVPNTFTLRLFAAVSNSLSNGTTVTGWSVASTAACTAMPPNGTTTIGATLAAGITFSGASLAPAASVFYCVRTVVDAAVTTTTVNPVGVNAQLASSIGNWSFAPAAVTVATQSVAPDTTAPTAPPSLTASATTSTQTTLSWGAATDAFGVTGYRVYRGGGAIATVTSLTYVSAGLTAGTTYSYTVRAFDAAGNESADSTAVAVATTNPFYYIVHSSGFCIDGDNSGGQGSKVIVYDCTGAQNQRWKFLPTSDGFVRVIPGYSSTLAWDIDVNSAAADFTKVALWDFHGGTNQQWKVEQQSGGTVRFVNRSSGKCLDLDTGNTNRGTQLQQYTCTGGPAQTWALSEAG